MLSLSPLDLSKISKENLDREIARIGMIAELDATSLYEQLAEMTDNKDLKTVLLDIAKEEKTHTSEFQTLLLRMDKEQEEENARQMVSAESDPDLKAYAQEELNKLTDHAGALETELGQLLQEEGQPDKGKQA